MKDVDTLQAKLDAAEKLQQQLLGRMNEIDRVLAGMQPADPQRVGLKAEKQEILPRYRGAKAHVKDLRRRITTLPIPKVQPDQPPRGIEDGILVDEGEEDDAILDDLAAVVARMVDRWESNRNMLASEDDIQTMKRFLDWWEE